MFVAEYGQFKLPESLGKLEPFKRSRAFHPSLSLTPSPKPTTVPQTTKAEPSLKTVIMDVAKGALTVALMKYLGMTPRTTGTQVSEPVMLHRPATVGAVAMPSPPPPRQRVPLGPLFLIGGAAFVVAALLLFRR